MRARPGFERNEAVDSADNDEDAAQVQAEKLRVQTYIRLTGLSHAVRGDSGVEHCHLKQKGDKKDHLQCQAPDEDSVSWKGMFAFCHFHAQSCGTDQLEQETGEACSAEDQTMPPSREQREVHVPRVVNQEHEIHVTGGDEVVWRDEDQEELDDVCGHVRDVVMRVGSRSKPYNFCC